MQPVPNFWRGTEANARWFLFTRFLIICDVSTVCPHKRVRSTCKVCGRSSICEHDHIRRQNKECLGSRFCPHKRQKEYSWNAGDRSYESMTSSEANARSDWGRASAPARAVASNVAEAPYVSMTAPGACTRSAGRREEEAGSEEKEEEGEWGGR